MTDQENYDNEIQLLEFLKGLRTQILTFDPERKNDNLKEALYTLDRLIARSLFKSYEIGEKL